MFYNNPSKHLSKSPISNRLYNHLSRCEVYLFYWIVYVIRKTTEASENIFPRTIDALITQNGKNIHRQFVTDAVNQVSK